MRKQLLACLLFTGLAFSISAQPFRYSEKVFLENDTIKDVEYAIAPWLNNLITLLQAYNIHDGENITEDRPLHMDIFMPRGDTVTKRPAIIFAHSGAFLLGDKNVDDMVAFCDSFALKGYVTATIEYRLGMGADYTVYFGVPSIDITETNAIRSLYRGLQDTRAAIRFLKKNAGLYGIDTANVFIAGSSAGGFLALQNAYIDKNDEIPEEVLNEPSLGGLDEYGEQGVGAQANAVASFWAAIESTELIENDSTPVYLVHGTADKTVPFKKGMPLEGIASPSPLISFKMPETEGSYLIDSALTRKGYAHESYFVEGEDHEFYNVSTGNFKSGGPNQYWDTINSQMTGFFYQLIKPLADFEININGFTVSLDNTSSDTLNVEWSFGNGVTSNEISPVYTYAGTGEYQISLKVFNRNMACDTISKKITLTDPGYAGRISIADIKYFPNPVNDKLNFSGISAPFNVSVYNITGVKQGSWEVTGNYIDVSYLTNGVYLFKIEKEGSSKIIKVVKSDN